MITLFHSESCLLVTSCALTSVNNPIPMLSYGTMSSR